MDTEKSLPSAELRRLFHQIGLKLTPQREAVWRLFEGDPAGFTIVQATEILGMQKLGQATVYRTIRALQDMGYLKWVHDRNGEHRYVASRPGHSHLLVCRVCSRAVACSDCDLSVLEKLISRQTGFAVEGHHLEFFGVCPECA